MKTKRFLSILLSLVLVLGMLPGMSLTAYAEGNTKTITPGTDDAKTGTGTMTITLKIKDAQTITASDVTATYGDTDKSVSGTTTGDGAISYSVKSGDAVTVDENTGALTIKKVGTATVIVTAAETATYKQATKEVIVTINEAAPTVTAPTAKTLTYNGQKQELVNAGSTKDGTMYYAVTTENKAPAASLYTTSIPTAINAGTYFVWYRAVGDDNHNDTAAECVTATISEPGRVPIYRMYNSATSEHLYTTSEAEYNSCGKGAYADWKAEGVAWLAPSKDQKGARPVRRLYNKGLGDHHYASEGEAKLLVEKHGWVDEGVAFYTMDEGSAPLGLHRLYNPGLTRGQHHYTASDGEAKALVSQHGWVDEGIAFWGWEASAK